MNISEVKKIIESAEAKSKDLFNQIDEISLFNQRKVLNAFKKQRVSARHFNPSLGYGYDDTSRDTLNKLFADVFKAEDALVSPLFVSGTHALTVALFGLLRPNDTLLAVSGKPYDTLDDVIMGKGIGSLSDFNINYRQIDLAYDDFDYNGIKEIVSTIKPKLVHIQRARGYSLRDAISIEKVEKAVKIIKEISPSTLIMVDNCYGEFVETKEPIEIGADIIVGSLIKNAGGGIAPTGAYICGKKDCIEQISYRLTAPSIGVEVGSYNASYLPFYEGLFLAPNVVSNALKCCILFANAYNLLGYKTIPSEKTMPKDITLSILFDKKEELIKFAQEIQFTSPVDSYVTPVPWDMPGYNNQVIMAAGTFVQGASIELSADAPIKDAPYAIYLQGALTYQHAKIALENCLLSLD